MASSAIADIYDADLYVERAPWALFAELRRTAPVHWREGAQGPGYWAVMRHEDVREVARQPELFSCSAKGVQIETPPPDQLEMARGMLTNMDPPLHAGYREPLMTRFTPKKIGELEQRIGELTREILQRAGEIAAARGWVEFVHEVCSQLPTRVFGEMMGLPREDWDALHGMAAALTRSQDPEVVASEAEKRSAGEDMFHYAMQFGMRRRREPPIDDLTGLMLDTEFNGARLDDIEFGKYFSQFIVAANETTVTLLSSGLQALLDHPEALAELRADLSLLPSAIEEMLRYATPLHYLARTATRDLDLGGQRIREGDRVVMYYSSANRDEAVFAEPDRFDIRRSPNPHLSFGYANHFCMGAHLARLEARVFFTELFVMFPRIEAAGEPRRLRSNFNNALKHFPVALHRN